MNSEHHKNEIDQIKKHVRVLNITGGVAISAIALAGILLVTDIFDAPAENYKVQTNITQVNDAPIEVNDKPVTGTSDIEIVRNDDAGVETAAIKSSGIKKAAPKAISFEEELQSFEASCNDGSILFQWVTSGGSKYAYEIEKTYDQVNYEVFSRAPQPEKKEGKNIYAIEESAVDGDNAFYRLRKVVGKGKYEYSEAVKVKCATDEAHAATVDVFPNGNGSFRIMINTAVAGPYKVSLSDANETVLATEEYNAKAGNNEFVLSSNSITRGNYVLRVSNDSMVKEKKVVLK